MPAQLMKFLIINADDFGYSPAVNDAVQRAHRNGVLTSASLMVAEPGWREAVQIAQANPRMGVGLHVVTTLDRSLLPPQEIPHLVSPQGKFGADPFRTGMKYAFSAQARRELRQELEAQFARFAETGIPWSHVDGHQHYHMHPVVWDNVLTLCDRYGVHRLRVPYEEWRPHRRDGGDGPNIDSVGGFFLRVLRRRCLRTLRARKTLGGKPIFHCDRVYGQFQTSDMHAQYTVRLLDRLGGQTNEAYFHPGTKYARALPPERQTALSRDVEMEALLSPEVAAKIKANGIRTGSYAEIERLCQGDHTAGK